jgi:hypothetical protein
MLRRAWRLRAAARVGAASTSAASPSSAAYAATFRTWLGPWSAAPLSSRADVPDDEQARRRTLRRAARRDLRAWRGADVTLRELRELRELEDGGGSKRRWARDWASAVFADDVGDGASYEAFVAEALRHGDGRRGPGSGPRPNEAEADTRRARHSSKKKAAGRTAAEGTRAGSGAPKGGGTRGVKYKHRRGDDRVRPEKKNASKRDARLATVATVSATTTPLRSTGAKSAKSSTRTRFGARSCARRGLERNTRQARTNTAGASATTSPRLF